MITGNTASFGASTKLVFADGGICILKHMRMCCSNGPLFHKKIPEHGPQLKKNKQTNKQTKAKPLNSDICFPKISVNTQNSYKWHLYFLINS